MFSGCADIPDPPNPRFRILAFYQEVDGATGRTIRLARDANRTLDGDLENADPGATGNIGFFDNFITDSSGEVDVEDGIAPATWTITARDGACEDESVDERFFPGEESDVYCRVTRIRLPLFFALPSSVDVNYPPASFTIQGSGIDAGGGMPWVEYWHPSGTLHDRIQAYEVASDGTWLNVHTPSFSQTGNAYGIYEVKVRLVSGEVIGLAAIEVYDSTTPLPTPDPTPCPPCPPLLDCQPCNNY